jgi:hypothetical protein
VSVSGSHNMPSDARARALTAWQCRTARASHSTRANACGVAVFVRPKLRLEHCFNIAAPVPSTPSTRLFWHLQRSTQREACKNKARGHHTELHGKHVQRYRAPAAKFGARQEAHGVSRLLAWTTLLALLHLFHLAGSKRRSFSEFCQEKGVVTIDKLYLSTWRRGMALILLSRARTASHIPLANPPPDP